MLKYEEKYLQFLKYCFPDITLYKVDTKITLHDLLPGMYLVRCILQNSHFEEAHEAC